VASQFVLDHYEDIAASADAFLVFVDGVFGFVDGALNALNPLDSIWSIPDIGPVFGNTTAYMVGNIAGNVAGMAAGLMIGNVAAGASGLVACGSLLQRMAKVYTAIDTVGGVASASVNVYNNGRVGVGDVLNFLPAVGFLAGKAGQKIGALSENCFIAGTMVMADTDGDGAYETGETEKIEDIEEGMWVLARDEDSGGDPDAPLVLKRVTQVFRRVAYDLQQVTVRGEGGNEETVVATDEHPFYVEGRGWTAAKDVRSADRLVSPDGGAMTVVANVDDKRTGGVAVYNFEVEDAHTYFVADGDGVDGFFWVHNICVYQEITKGRPSYIGFTTQTIEARAAQQLRTHGRSVASVRGLEDLSTKKLGRALEHLLIQKYGRKGIDPAGILTNINRGIDPAKIGKYTQELKEATAILKRLRLLK